MFALLLLLIAQADVAKDHFDKGNQAYAVGRFDEALVEFTAAYDAFPAPEFVFNIGQCHFNLGHYDDAGFFYEKYLEARPDAEVARKQLAEARRLGTEQRAADAAAAEDARVKEAARLAEANQGQLAESRHLEDVRRLAAKEQRQARADEDERNAWFLWGGVGGGTLLVAAVATAVAAVVLTPPQKTVLPSGTLGAIDRRRSP